MHTFIIIEGTIVYYCTVKYARNAEFEDIRLGQNDTVLDMSSIRELSDKKIAFLTFEES